MKLFADFHGFIMDEQGNLIEKASLKVIARDVGFQTTKCREFWKILTIGLVSVAGEVPRRSSPGGSRVRHG